MEFLRRHRRRRRGHRRLAGRLPVHRRHRRVRRGRALLPRLADPHGVRHASPSAWCSRRSSCPSSTTTARSPRRRPGWSPPPGAGRSSRWARGAPTSRPRSPPPAPPTSPASPSTSNLAAGRRYGIPTTGTAAHAFTLLHDDEPAAFASQVAALGKDTTLLVDTYDIAQGIRNAIAVAGPELRRHPDRLRRPAVLAQPVAGAARLAGRHRDEDHRLRRSRRVRHRRARRRTGRHLRRRHRGGHRLRRADRRADLQAGRGGRPAGGQALGEQGHRRRPQDGGPAAQADRHRDRGGRGVPGRARAAQPATALLQRPFMRGASRCDLPTLDESREHLRQCLISIPWEGLKLSAGDPAIPVIIGPAP